MPSPAELADHPGIVFGAYIAALLPLTVIYALDFISDEWRTIRETRRKGHLYLVTSIIPLCFLMYYIHLQKVAKDYKEMAAATSAAVFCIFHILRTVWGLLQLDAFKQWNIRALHCLNRIGYDCPVDTDFQETSMSPPGSSYLQYLLTRVTNMFKNVTNMLDFRPNFNNRSMNLSEDLLAHTVDNVMVVNSSLVDNEFGGAELPCRLNFSSMASGVWAGLAKWSSFRLSDHLFSTALEECSVQWMVAFLSKFGSEWVLRAACLQNDESIMHHVLTGAWAMAATTTNREVHGICSFLKIFSPLLEHRCATYVRSIFMDESASALPYGQWNCPPHLTLDFRAFESSIRNGCVSWHSKSLHALRQSERDAVQRLHPVHLGLFYHLMEGVFDAGVEFTIDNAPYAEEVCEHPGFGVLLAQISCTSQAARKVFSSWIPISSDRYMASLWNGRYQNNLLLQASAHIDNRQALLCGQRIHQLATRDRLDVTTDTSLSVFQAQRVLELLSREVLKEGIGGDIRFIGCVAEAVRTFLAHWMSLRSENNCSAQPDWQPEIENKNVEIQISRQLRDALMGFRRMWSHVLSSASNGKFNIFARLLWELQIALQQSVTRSVEEDVIEDMPSSETLMMLFLLGYPALHIIPVTDMESADVQQHLREVQEKGYEGLDIFYSSEGADPLLVGCGVIVFRITPVEGPQKVYLQLAVELETGRANLKPIGQKEEGGRSRFKWQLWKDALMGRLAGQSDFRRTAGHEKRDRLRKESFDSDLSDPVKLVTEKLKLWTGWPPFLCQISILGMDGLLLESKMENYSISANLLEAEMNKWRLKADVVEIDATSPEEWLNEAVRARETENIPVALAYLWKCISEQCCSIALGEAITLIHSRIPVSEQEKTVLELLQHMRSAFTACKGRRRRKSETGKVSGSSAISAEVLSESVAKLREKFSFRFLLRWHIRWLLDCSESRAMPKIEWELPFHGECDFREQLLIFLAHLRNVKMSGGVADQWLALHCLKRMAKSWRGLESFCRLAGFLLEKGAARGRECHRLSGFLAQDVDLHMEDVLKYAVLPQSTLSSTCMYTMQRSVKIRRRMQVAASLYEAVIKFLRNRCGIRAIFQNRLGILHLLGSRAFHNVSAAESLFRLADVDGNVDATCNLGTVFFHNYGDSSTGSRYYMRAISDSQLSRGSSASYQPNFEKVSEEVILDGCPYKIWYKSDICQAPHSTAMNNLAVLYEKCNEAANGGKLALELYQKILDIDENPVALYNMAFLLMSTGNDLQNVQIGSKLLDKIMARRSDIAHMLVLMQNLDKLVTLPSESLALDWTVVIQELDDCGALVKVIDENSEIEKGDS